MKQFNVLDRHLDLHRHYLLEASAGTGKTFSIQTIIVRLLIESNENNPPLSLNKILVTTFTRAAARDLRQRVRFSLEQAVQLLTGWQETGEPLPSSPDYLLAYLEKGEEFVKKAKKSLQQALFIFDQAQIFTIHSFCARMLRQYALEGDMGLQTNASTGEEPLPSAEVMRLIRDFFRTEIRQELYSPGQLAIILKEDPEQKKLLRAILSGYQFAKMPACQELYRQFIDAMQAIKQALNPKSDYLAEDFKEQSGSYRNHKSGETKADTLAKIMRFAELWDQDEWTLDDFDLLLKDGLAWVEALDPRLLKSRATASESLRYPAFTQLLTDHLKPIIDQAADFPLLLARLSGDCQQLVKRYQKEEEKLAPDDLLRKMQWGLQQPEFKANVQSLYEAAIIDEFQDTDPIQWDIFSRLYLPEDQSWNGYLYLVGDPKQSIYSFRQADIYTYLAAAKALGEERCFSLDTNYRSQPSLVQALNVLFSNELVPRFIALPRQNFHLPYQPVQAAKTSVEKEFDDDKKAVHFFIADGKAFKKPKLKDMEKSVFFPFIAQEIENLRSQGLEYRQCAVLVRDRHQASRLADYFDCHKIPYLNQRGASLAESIALSSLIDVLQAVLHPHDLGAAKTALGCALIGWTYEDLKRTSQLNVVLVQIQRLRRGLMKQGFSCFFQDFLQTKWLQDESTVLERLLKQERGLDLYHDLQQIADLIIRCQYRDWTTPEGLIAFLDLFQAWHADDDERIKRFQDPTKNGVKILTLHVSKGLEFDVVFALGLANRTGVRDELIPIEKEGELVLSPLSEHSEERQRYCEENDAEKMRQLYVAMTRSKYRLYLPVALHLPSDSLKSGEASPMELFLGRLGQPLVSYQALYQRLQSFDEQIFIQCLESIGQKNGVTHSIHQEVVFNKKEETLLSVSLSCPSSVFVPGKAEMAVSFSSLTSQSTSDQAKKGGQTPPYLFEQVDKTPHTLPAGSETGLLFHHLLEKLPFHEFKDMRAVEQVLPLIRPFVQKTSFKNWLEVIGEMIFNAIKAPFQIEETYFCLADLMPFQIYREMPFLFPCQKDLTIEGLSFSEGFIKGTIDLIFVYQERYYIVDWKSNWLGTEIDSYRSADLEEAMVDRQYVLQASLYTEALRRFLKLVDSRPFEECFGGVIYAFLRGMRPGEQTGIHAFKPAYFSTGLIDDQIVSFHS